MGICWYCHWGWAKPVRDIYDTYSLLVTDADTVLDYGIGHIVWADENFDTHNIEWCIKHAYDLSDLPIKKEEHSSFNRMTGTDLMLSMQALKELLLIPEEIRDCIPEEYDRLSREYDNTPWEKRGQMVLPEDYPPPKDIIMVKK